MRNLVASSIRRWRLPLAPNLSSPDGVSEQIVATCYDAESRVTYAVTDACNMYGLRDSAREGDDAELCLEMSLVESVPSATDAFDAPKGETASARREPDAREANPATENAKMDGDDDVERRRSSSPSASSSLPPVDDAMTPGAGLRRPSPVIGAAFVDDLRGVCVACATGELLLVAPDPDDDDAAAPGAILTADMTPECVGRVATGLRAMCWNPDGELLVLATWAGTLILMTKEFRVLAEAPVGGGAGDGVASLSWRGDGQFLASLISAHGAEPQLRVWEREDLTFHATGESLRPARIGTGDPRGGGGGEEREGVSASPPHAPPLAWQPRGALVAVACVPQRAREDTDTDTASASDALDEQASRRDGRTRREARASRETPPTKAEIVFFERNGLRRGSFALPARGTGARVTSLAWSCDSERLAVCVANPEAFEAAPRKPPADGAPEKDFAARAATQIWRRGNGKWYLSREVVFPAREGDRVYCAWDLTDPRVLRIATPAGRVEEHAFADERIVSSAATTATIDGADVLVTPLARALFPPPMCAATVTFPATVSDACFCPATAIRPPSRTPSERDETRARGYASGDRSFSSDRFVPRGEAVLALLSDGRLAVASAWRATAWEETVERIADADDELEYGKADAHLDARASVKMEARVVAPVDGTRSVLERFDDVPRRVAWLDAETALVAADRPSDGSAYLLTVRLSFESTDDDTREPRWFAEAVSATDLPAAARAIALAEGVSPAGAFVQTQGRVPGSNRGFGDVNEDGPADALASSTSVVFASVVLDERGDPTLSAIPASWPSASLPESCVALAALPPTARGAPPALAGLDERGALFCGERVVARDVRSFAVHFGDVDGEGARVADDADAALASARAYAERWRKWSVGADDAALGPPPPRPEARLVCATLADELCVVELAELAGERASRVAVSDVGVGVGAAAEKNAFAAAAGGTRTRTSTATRPGDASARGASIPNAPTQQNDRMHVSMRAAMRPADAGRDIDSRTRRIEQGARIVAAIPGGVDVVLQMPRGNLETVAPRFLVLPAVARALDERRFAAAAALAARHRVDLNLIVDRAWPRFLDDADAFVRDVDDPDVVAELLECLDAGDCTARGAPYAHLAAPVPEEAASFSRNETAQTREDADHDALLTDANACGLLTRPSLDLLGLARAMTAKAEASPRDPVPDAATADEDTASKAALRDDPRGKIRLTCSAIARAVARAAAEKDAAGASASASARPAGPAGPAHSAVEPAEADADALLSDRWELVMLSAHARSSPPDLEGALGRVRRRRELEIAEARGAASARPAPIAAEGRGASARLASGVDRSADRARAAEVDAEAALDHLLALEGGKPLFDAAMGTYDLSVAYLVGQRAPGMDPGEYVPELERLQAMPEPLRRADIDLKLGRWRGAIENLLRGGDATRACALAAKRRLFPHALAVAAEKEREAREEAEEAAPARLGGAKRSSVRPAVSALRRTVAAAYAAQLGEERRHEDAAVVLLSVGETRAAMRAYVDASAWRPALALAGRLALPAAERRALAAELADALEPFDPAAAAAVAERELGDVDRAASLLCAARKWRDALSVAYARGRGDLVETTVAPAAAEAASGIVASAREAPARAAKYLERVRALRQRREALEKALKPSGVDGGVGGAFGRPGTRRDDDDDGASDTAASVSTLASGVSGFSAYTDRTAGAATATTATGTSLSASTVGGRKAKKPTRAERRGKRAGAGLRAGGPTEERDLANHLASGGVAGDLLAVGALERVGELSELLVVLGHADDAAKLQSAVAAAIAAHEHAGTEARRALDALDAAEAEATGGDEAHALVEKKHAPCACASCVAHGKARCLAAKNAQWKWAALREATSPNTANAPTDRV